MLSETAEFVYKTTNYYNPSFESISYSILTIKIQWPNLQDMHFKLSNKDLNAKNFFNNNSLMQ